MQVETLIQPLIGHECNQSQRRQLDLDGVVAALPGEGVGGDTVLVTDIAASVSFGIGIEDFAVKARLRHPDAVTGADHGSGVHGEDETWAIGGFAQEGDDAVVGVVEIDPLETIVGVIEFVEGRVFLVDLVKMLDQPAEARVQRKLGEVPVEALIVTPFLPLTEFATLEEQFLSGMRPHERVKHPQIGEFLPHVSGHFAE